MILANKQYSNRQSPQFDLFHLVGYEGFLNVQKFFAREV